MADEASDHVAKDSAQAVLSKDGSKWLEANAIDSNATCALFQERIFHALRHWIRLRARETDGSTVILTLRGEE